MPTYSPFDVTLIRGEGCWVYDSNNKKYLDFFSGIAVNSLGHSHPLVVKAISEQAAKLIHVSNIYKNEYSEKVAEILNALIAVDENGMVFFTNSGTEAVECALKLVRATKGPLKVVSCINSFHGRSYGALSLTGQDKKAAKFEPLLQNISKVPYGDINALEKEFYDGVAGVFLEPIQGEGGIIEPPNGYLKAVYELCKANNALMAVDEIQTGLGRSGKWFCFQYEDVAPDLVMIAKPLANGYPAGACWAKKEVALNFSVGDHGSTFAGQPLALAAAKATLEALIELNAPLRAQQMGNYLINGLSKVPKVKKVRGRAMLIGLILNDPISKEVSLKALNEGLLINSLRDDVIRIAPPLIITKEEIDLGIEILNKVLGEL